MRLLPLLLILLLSLSSAEPPSNSYGPYNGAELDALARSLIAAGLAMIVFASSIFQKARPQRPSWDIGLAQTIQTGFLAVVAVLVVRFVSNDNLAAEWLTGAAVGIRGPKAVDWILEAFGKIWRKGGKND